MKINKKKILIVDDEADIRRLIRGILEDEGYDILEAENSKEAFSIFESEKPDLAILDIWLQGSEKDGLEILENFKTIDQHFPVLMISGHGNIETAVNAIKIGAYDFIEKPFKSDRLLLMIARGLESASIKKENTSLKEYNDLTQNLFFYLAPEMQSFMDALKALSTSSKSIFVTGQNEEMINKVVSFLVDCDSTKSKKRTIAKSKSELDNVDFEVLEIPAIEPTQSTTGLDLPLREAREAFERDYLLEQIKKFDGNISKTASFVGMERSALHRKLKSLDISPDDAQNGQTELNRQTG